MASTNGVVRAVVEEHRPGSFVCRLTFESGSERSDAVVSWSDLARHVEEFGFDVDAVICTGDSFRLLRAID